MEERKLYESVEDWLVHYKKTSVKPATYDRLKRSLITMGQYPISGVAVEDLTSRDIQDYINELVDSGYALTTIKKQFHLLSEYISYENLMGTIARPLHKGVKLPSESTVKKRKKDVIAYTPEEQRRLSNVLMTGESPAYFVAILMMETGLRIGEALALTWDDIDWNRRALSVNKTVVRLGDSKNSYVQRGAKSFTSNRVIPLSRNACLMLRDLRERDRSLRGYVFHRENGDYLTYETVRWNIQKACARADVPYYGQHVFRHTFATNCYNKGCDVKVLSKFLGHADVTVTSNVYIHLFGDALEEMRSIVG